MPVKLIMEALSAADYTLLHADIALKFMFDELSTSTTSVSRELKNELLLRIWERRSGIYGYTITK